MTTALQSLPTTMAVLQQKLYGLPSGLAYYVEINIGSPVYSSSSSPSSINSFNLLVDTGSANTAVVTAQCCALTNEKVFSCQASSTCVDEGASISVRYISSSWTGEKVRDTFSGQGLGLIESMPFAQILVEDNFVTVGYDGIIGLGYESIASPSDETSMPYFDVVSTRNGLNDVFSMQMCGTLQALSLRNVSTEDTSFLYAGELLLGGTEGPNGQTYHQGDIVFTPLVHERFYNVIVTDIGANGQSLGIDCESINSPRAIVDSGSSNVAFPSSVYTAVIAELRAQVAQVASMDDSFFSDDSTCCSNECDPGNLNSFLYRLPGLTISLALENNESQQMTFTIPATYIWRPIVIPTGIRDVTCRVFGISEGDFTLLGNVFMDGLFTVHDRLNARVGMALADNCPNGVASGKRIIIENMTSKTSFCDCVGSSDRKNSLISSVFPFSSRPCFFWQWWMYVVIVALTIALLMAIAYVYVWWRHRKLTQQLQNETSFRNTVDSVERLDPNLFDTPTHSSSVYMEESLSPLQKTAAVRHARRGNTFAPNANRTELRAFTRPL
ncbi:hypothetical protein CCR75_001250 [Bremia lactucae]|uniref:Peptidase A1 domain-containing protein n=1 Tax=Bremia lactucae TaxID=4779 RepID=A0A976NY14_BRELC|nr:hypothetical protein CCR75_001250 [Bremia lactucae]